MTNEDLTNEQALEQLREWRLMMSAGDVTNPLHRHNIETIEKAIQALEAQTSDAEPAWNQKAEDIYWSCVRDFNNKKEKKQEHEAQPTDAVSRKSVIILVDRASEEHPYKVVGDSETYSNYNQGWSDACDWLYANIEGLPSANPQTVTEFADKCKECGKIQNEFFNFDAPMVKNSEAVSREAVIRLIKEYETTPSYTDFYALIEDVKALPKESLYINPKKVGKWIKYDVDIAPHPLHCSICGFSSHHISDRYIKEFRRCPNCGAEMGGSDETDN